MGKARADRAGSVILAVDTTEDRVGLALRSEGRVLSWQSKPEVSHDEALLPGVDALLKKAGLKLKDLSAIAAASGPGRFTGIRVGMAYAAVACARLGIPALAISRLEALAWKGSAARLCAAIPGWREERYYQVFSWGSKAPRPEAPPAWASAQDWPRVRRELERKGCGVLELRPSAADLLIPAGSLLGRGRVPKFEPLYLKPASYERKPHSARLAR